MFESIFVAIIYFFVEIVFEIIILGLFRGVHYLGLVALKVITLSGQSIDKLKEKYKDSSKPYFLGFGIVIGLGFLIARMT